MDNVRANLAILIVTWNESRILGAVRSIVENKQDVSLVYLVDNGTVGHVNRAKLFRAHQLLRQKNIRVIFVRNKTHLPVTEVRRVAYDALLRECGIDLITCLDADDRVGKGAFAALRQAYIRSGGVADVVVPRHILEVVKETLEFSVRELVIPMLPECPDHLPMVAGAWATLTSVGATFAVSTRAAYVHRHFAENDTHDEWVRMLCLWARQGAQFVYADVEKDGCYWYYQHPLDHHAAERRASHAATRTQIAASILASN